ncbi:DUF2752 domain-containing protein [Mycolicibacterium rhodesiae]|uniref:DUF2752 domain-containing protein n=1 Tax=Mycolicibacterium rhodesiae TaxID=36814 RepID=A0A1X0IK40_MYCRH|nr:DUF2752 domain-containing protein [Mycolicibacterium rhodesiae]MCV7346404.1 DUF2752 domain-containing protein [Mycolicibacterium rhodesiae]ORB48170.1 hypothetical protein BST42_26285 [Mycolicibacterium rhodesiae]
MDSVAHRRRTRLYTGAATGVLGIGALTYVGIVDPHRPGSLFPPCPFRLLTGWNCPACGGLRMTHDLLHGDIAAAVVDNAFLLVGLPLLAVWAIWRIRRGERAFPLSAISVIAVAAITWTVIRNLPGFPLVPTLIGQ